METIDYIKFPFWLCWVILIRVILIILGLPIVALGLCFARDFPETKVEMSRAPGNYWWLQRLPDWEWIYLWDNDRDGSLGDRRGSWFNMCDGKSDSFWNRWWWMAIRNPVNNMRFHPSYRCEVLNCDYTLRANIDINKNSEWWFIKFIDRTTKKSYYCFEYKQTRKDGKIRNIRLGYKLWRSVVEKLEERNETLKHGILDPDMSYWHEGRRYRGFTIQLKNIF